MTAALGAAFTEEARTVVGHLRQAIQAGVPPVRLERIGRVAQIGDGVATATGLANPVAGELLDVAGVPARAELVSETAVKVVLLGSSAHVEAGSPVRRTGRVLDIPAGPQLLGRVVDSVGRPIDDGGPIESPRRIPVDGPPTALAHRDPVRRPLRTGLFVLDTMIPIGRGQRQLVVGDRSTGKSALCLDILAALDPGVIGVYVSIGKRGSDVAAHLQWLRSRRFFDHGFAVVGDSVAPIGMIQAAPYTAMAMAEDFALSGRDVVVVLDDLTSHAHAHRTLALLLDRPVGREAYPADVFYAHARLLERSAQLSEGCGGGSLTALPVIVTQAGDLTGYIPTNLVSITDGQIRLDARLVAEGQVPAVDVGLSVSRVGGKAQPPLIRSLAGALRNRYAQFLELEAFARFGARVEAAAQERIDSGRRVRHALRQGRAMPLSWGQIALGLLVLEDAALARCPIDLTPDVLQRVRRDVPSRVPGPWADLEAGRDISAADLSRVRVQISEVLRAFTDELEEGP